MDKRKRLGALPALMVAVVGWGGIVGCSETAIQGSVLDQDVSSLPELQLALAVGSNSEVTDVMTVGTGYKYWVLSGTDDILNAGSAGSEERAALGIWDHDDGDTHWEQGMEAAWAGLKVVNNANIAFTSEVFNNSPIVTRGYLNSAHGERLLGDAFCQFVYGFSTEGGFAIPFFGSNRPDPELLRDKDEPYRRMAIVAELAVAAAQRSVDAGVDNPQDHDPDSDALFDPEKLVLTAHGVAAQAYHALAVLGTDSDTNWGLAVQHAAQVPTSFVEYTIHDEDVEINELWDITWDNDDVTLFSKADATMRQGFLGVPATWLWMDDERVQVQNCRQKRQGPNSRCRRTRSERPERFDMVVPLKYDDEGSDDEMVTGGEMRLIEAEEALVRRGDFTTFYDKIDDARAFHGEGPTERIMVMGALEWPNAQDDAMSILDRERYLEMWMEGRRLFDLFRWNHPFITENWSMMPRHQNAIDDGGVIRAACQRLPEVECNLSPGLGC